MYDELRRAILERLRQEADRKRRPNELLTVGGLGYLLPDRKFNRDEDNKRLESLACQIFHELYLERIIVPGTASFSSTGTMQWPWFNITDHGRRVLQTQEYSPYDPNGYLLRLKSEIPDVDETIVRYVEESLKCLKMDCLLAAAVTIGCASEQTMLLLIEQFGQAITDRKKQQEYEGKTSTWIISRKYKAFRESLESVAKDLPKELRDPLEQQLHGVFDLIRQIRNEAGHPTGQPTTREAILTSLVMFPIYCKYLYALMSHFATNSVSL